MSPDPCVPPPAGRWGRYDPASGDASIAVLGHKNRDTSDPLDPCLGRRSSGGGVGNGTLNEHLGQWGVSCPLQGTKTRLLLSER